MLETLQGDLGCNRRVEGLCFCVSYQLVHITFRSQICDVEFGCISPHFVGMQYALKQCSRH